MTAQPTTQLALAPSIAVIGCGNPNRRDDGAGPEVLRILHTSLDCAAHVRLLDAGTDGMAVMFAARGCRTLILVDACRSGAAPGSIFEAPGSELANAPRSSLGLHDFRWDHALYAGRRIFREAFPAEVTVFLIEAGDVAFGIGLTGPVSAAAAQVAARIRDRVREALATEDAAHAR